MAVGMAAGPSTDTTVDTLCSAVMYHVRSFSANTITTF